MQNFIEIHQRNPELLSSGGFRPPRLDRGIERPRLDRVKLDGSGCRIHSVSDGSEEIVTNERYVVMLWKMVTRHDKNMTLEEVVEEIKKREEDRRLVSKFDAEHRDEIDEILD